MPGLVDAARTLMGVGVSAKQVIPTLTAYGDAAGALGIQQDAFQRIMIAVSQSISAGKIKLGDMNQLANNGLPIWKLMSEAMHKPVPELQAMISHGKLLSADVLPKLQAQMEKDYGGSMAKQSQTLGGLWSTMMDTFRLGMANALMPLVPILQAILPGAMAALGNAFKGLADGIRAGIGFFQQIGPSLHKAFGDPKTASDVNTLRATVTNAFTQIWAVVGPALRQIWQTIQTQVAPAFQSFVKAMIPVVNFFVKVLTPVVKTQMQAVLSIIDGVLKIISGIFNVLAGILTGNWSKVWAGLKQITSGGIQVVMGLIKHLSAGIVAAFNGLGPKMREIGKHAMVGLGKGIVENAPMALNPASAIGGKIGDVISGALGIHSPSRVTMKIGQNVMAGLEIGLRQRAPSVYAFLERFAQRIGDMKVTAGTKNILEKLVVNLADDMQRATSKLDKVKDQIKAQQAKVADLIKARNDYAAQLSSRRVRWRLDRRHPVGAGHHRRGREHRQGRPGRRVPGVPEGQGRRDQEVRQRHEQAARRGPVPGRPAADRAGRAGHGRRVGDGAGDGDPGHDQVDQQPEPEGEVGVGHLR
jgi:tape measure domain-containing protein